jgi:hydrogenase-4 component B
VSDPTLLFLSVDVGALLLLGTLAALIPPAACGFLVTALCGLGAMLCLPVLLHLQPTRLTLPVGPPGLSLHLTLDPLAAALLAVVFLSGTAVAAFQATTVPLTKIASIRQTALCVAATVFSLMAADGVALTIGVAAIGVTMFHGQRRKLPIPLVVLAAVCLLTPFGSAPQFDIIRAATITTQHTTAAQVLTLLAVVGLAWPDTGERCWTRDALNAGVILPTAAYLLLRLAEDLPGAAGHVRFGFLLMLTGGAVAVLQGWRSAACADIDTAIAALIRRHAGLAISGIGLALVARAEDLPNAASFALEAVFLTVIGGGIAGTLASLASHAIGASAGTYRLSRLGGLVRLMPGASAALAASILALSALPPGLGFATLWLLFQSILAAPRTGGLLSQLPLAATAAAFALSAALATAASTRLIGIALLGRPRSPRGSSACESTSPPRTILLTLGAVSLAVGILPGPVLRILAEPAIRILIGGPPSRSALLSIWGPSPGYLALPVLAMLAFAIGAVMLASRRVGQPEQTLGIWTNGTQPPFGLPFGEPAAQSMGAGFLPTPPPMPPTRAALTALSKKLPPTLITALGSKRPACPSAAAAGIWGLLAATGVLLLVLAVTG